METINVKEQARSLIDRLPENITWQDFMYECIKEMQQSEASQIQEIQPVIKLQNSPFIKKNIFDVPSSERVNMMKFLSAILNSEGIKRERGITTISDCCNEPLDLLPPGLLDRLLEKAKELTKLSAELAEIIATIDSERTTNREFSGSPPKKQRRPPLFGSDRDVISLSEKFDEPLEDFQDYM